MSLPTWLPLRPQDLAAVDAIGIELHPDFPERWAVPEERLKLFPDGCFRLEINETTVGYAISHPARLGHPPALDSLMGALPSDADCLHLHDVAILPRFQGGGRGGGIIEHLNIAAHRHGLPWLSLIAVHGTGPFWRRHGFAPWTAHPANLASYGEAAEYLHRPVGD